MAINFYQASPANGFFNIVGKLFKTQGAINTSRGTTIPADIVAIGTNYNLQTLTAALNAAYTPIPGTVSTYQSGAAGTLATLQAFVQAFLILIVNTDVPQTDSSLTTALLQFIAQMKSQGVTLNASAVTVAATAGGSNYGDGVCIVTKKSGTGLTQENSIAETVLGTAQATSRNATFGFVGQAAPSGSLGQDWPAGSAANKAITAIDANLAAGSVLTNGGFETFANQPNVPDNWILAVGTPGTHLIATTIEVQTITRAGTPTAGTWTISWANAAGKVQTTGPLAYNATGATVQAAIRTIAGLGSITVVETGTTPNFTDTITFNGMGGNVAQFTVTDNTTGGTHSITPATTTGGTPQVFAGGQALKFVGDGATLTALYQQITTGLQPSTAYAVSLWAICDTIPAAGVVKIELVDGIGGSVINDGQAVANAITFNASALLTTWQHLSVLQAAECIFRTPAQLPPLVYIRIRLSTAITNTDNMWVDQVAMTAVTEFYPGGPGAAIFTGSKTFDIGDTYSVAVTNDRAGLVREWMNRNLDLAGKELLLPTSGAPSVPDSVAT
jgi:hypothetical protein